MKILVSTKENRISIPIPNGMLFSKPAVWMFLKVARKASVKYISENAEEKAERMLSGIPEDAVYALCKELTRIKRKYGQWDLVEVESASGDQVLIQL